jgi:hypothetical protein
MQPSMRMRFTPFAGEAHDFTLPEEGQRRRGMGNQSMSPTYQNNIRYILFQRTTIGSLLRCHAGLMLDVDSGSPPPTKDLRNFGDCVAK